MPLIADGDVFDILVQARRNAKAAKRFFSRLVGQFDQPRVVVTDKLGSYVTPIPTIAPDADHRAHKGLNNKIDYSHRQTRKREKIMGGLSKEQRAALVRGDIKKRLPFLEGIYDQIGKKRHIAKASNRLTLPSTLLKFVCGD